MSKLIRHYLPGQSIFITSVTANRKPLLVNHAKLLTQAIKRSMTNANFTLVAWVILPDHFHLIINAADVGTPKIMRSVKRSFTGQYQSLTGRTGSVWQHRYWDHIIRDQEDMNRHIDYIHFNPVKHRLVNSPNEYSLSSFIQFCNDGFYDVDWRAKECDFGECDFGE